MLTAAQYFLWLMIYSVLGWVYETILCSCQERKFVNRGFFNGPYCPIYGFGAILDLLVLGRLENPFLLFFAGVFLTGVLEYFTSWAMEVLFHARWWDYSEMKFNLNGRVCLLGAAAFGAFSVLLIKVLHPAVSACTGKIPPKVLPWVAGGILCLVLADCIYTLTAVSGFDKKLAALSAELSQLTENARQSVAQYKDNIISRIERHDIHEKLSGACEKFLKRINLQERRMLAAFPALRSSRYNEALQRVKEWIRAKRKEKDR